MLACALFGGEPKPFPHDGDASIFLFHHDAAPQSLISGDTAASIAMTALRFSSILGFERSVDCALGRDHCRRFVVGLT
jgi:hypothetical protein